MKNTNSIRLMTSNVLGNWKDGFIENRDDVMAEIYLDLCPDVIALQEFSARYRKDEDLTLSGDLYRLISPETDKFCAYMKVSKDKAKANCLQIIVEGIQK